MNYFSESNENARWFQNFYLKYISILAPVPGSNSEILKQKKLFFAVRNDLYNDIFEMNGKIYSAINLAINKFNIGIWGLDIKYFIGHLQHFVKTHQFIENAHSEKGNDQYTSAVLLFNCYIKPFVESWCKKQIEPYQFAQNKIINSAFLNDEIMEFNEFPENNDNFITFFDLIIGCFDEQPEILEDVKMLIDEYGAVFHNGIGIYEEKNFQLFFNDQKNIVFKFQSIKDRFIKYINNFFEHHPNQKTRIILENIENFIKKANDLSVESDSAAYFICGDLLHNYFRLAFLKWRDNFEQSAEKTILKNTNLKRKAEFDGDPECTVKKQKITDSEEDDNLSVKNEVLVVDVMRTYFHLHPRKIKELEQLLLGFDMEVIKSNDVDLDLFTLLEESVDNIMLFMESMTHLLSSSRVTAGIKKGIDELNNKRVAISDKLTPIDQRRQIFSELLRDSIAVYLREANAPIAASNVQVDLNTNLFASPKKSSRESSSKNINGCDFSKSNIHF